MDDGQIQLLAGTPKFPASQTCQLDLQSLDLQLLDFDRTVALLEQLPKSAVLSDDASVGHEPIIRAAQ